MKHILEAMHTEAMHGFSRAKDYGEQCYFNGRTSALTDLLRLLHHDEQVRAYTTAEVHDITQEEESREAAA